MSHRLSDNYMESQHTSNNFNLRIGQIPNGADSVSWSIRGVEIDTRFIIEKAAERAGKTLGQYVNEDIRSLIQNQHTQNQASIAPGDMQNQVYHLTKMVEALTNRVAKKNRKPLWRRLFR